MKSNLGTTNEICEFLGWHMGDGCISINGRYSEYALTGDITEEYPFYKSVIVPSFNQLFSKHLKEPVGIRRYKSTGVCGIYLFDKKFVKLLQKKFKLLHGKKLHMRIPPVVQTDFEKKCFLRGLFDTDGSVYFCKSSGNPRKNSLYCYIHHKPKIKIGTISRTFMFQVFDMLVSLGFSPRWCKPYKHKKNEHTMYSLVLDTITDTKKWFEQIGFRNQKHLTKVSVWMKYGFCPPYTTLKQRLKILNGNLDPLTFYPQYPDLSRNQIHELKIASPWQLQSPYLQNKCLTFRI